MLHTVWPAVPVTAVVGAALRHLSSVPQYLRNIIVIISITIIIIIHYHYHHPTCHWSPWERSQLLTLVTGNRIINKLNCD